MFETAPLTEDIELTGVIEANLWISTDGADTDFTIKLIDVYATEGQGLTRRVAMNAVFMDADRPSHVVLPLIPQPA